MNWMSMPPLSQAPVCVLAESMQSKDDGHHLATCWTLIYGWGMGVMGDVMSSF